MLFNVSVTQLCQHYLLRFVLCVCVCVCACIITEVSSTAGNSSDHLELQ